MMPFKQTILLILWFVTVVCVTYFADHFQVRVFGWPLYYWLNAQGLLLFFVGIAWLLQHFGKKWQLQDAMIAKRLIVFPVEHLKENSTNAKEFKKQLRSAHRLIVGATVFLAGVFLILWFAQKNNLSKTWISGLLLFVTLGLYAVIGMIYRTSDPLQYYVAGREVPAIYTGMAAAADWMSAASFISLAGTIYFQSFSGYEGQAGGLAYLIGWTGGFCLIGFLVAPYLRAVNIYTLADFFYMRFGGIWPRRLAAYMGIICSFAYLIAQIYAVGLIAARLTGIEFEIGIILGLGGVLLCSFLGGMRAVTWTQVVQYVVMICAFVFPVSWLAYEQTGNFLAPLAYGQQIDKISQMEQVIMASPQEQQGRAYYEREIARLQTQLANVPQSLLKMRQDALQYLYQIHTQGASTVQLLQASHHLQQIPKDPQEASRLWYAEIKAMQKKVQPLSGITPQMQVFGGEKITQQQYETNRRNFVLLIFSLMIGTMSLPHVLTRFVTTASVQQTRRSIFWALLFIIILYLCIPALAILTKVNIFQNIITMPLQTLPEWINQWAAIDSSLLQIADINADGLLQLVELTLGGDIIMLASPEISGLTYLVSGVVTAGGLAASLSTADALLLTIGNALSYDLNNHASGLKVSPFQNVRPFGKNTPVVQQKEFLLKGPLSSFEVKSVFMSKFSVLSVAIVAAILAAQKPSNILNLVTLAFSLAGAAFSPSLVFGIFCRRVTRASVVVAILVGFWVSLLYLCLNTPLFGVWFKGDSVGDSQYLLWNIDPASSGLIGAVFGVLSIVLMNIKHWLLGAKTNQNKIK